MPRYSLLVALLGTLVAGAHGASAEDAGLYAAPPPPNAAFVRVLNADTAAEAAVRVGDIDFAVPPGALSPYEFVTMGGYEATVPRGSLPVTLEAQRYYTLVLSPGAGSDAVVEDQAIQNPVHAGLYFYNTTGVPLELDAQVNGKQAAVFQAVAPGAAVSREVNAFEVTFVLMNSGTQTAELPPIAMVRQQGVSVMAIEAGDQITLVQTVNTVATGD